jgi:Ino eighty subunit 2
MQAETINRLLKKQSKAKNKRNVLYTADDRTPVSVTPAVVQSAREGSEAPEGEVFEPVQLIPTMYRWTSTTKPPPVVAAEGTEAASQDDSEGKMRLMFSIPVSVLPPEGTVPQASEAKPTPSIKPICDVSGCQQTRKYRVVKDWMKGACGMEHLKVLEHQMDVA